MIQLGDKVKCKVTGFTGIAIGKTEWLNGCIRWTVQPHGTDKDGKIFASECFDDKQLAVIKNQSVDVTPKRTGGPMPSVSRGQKVR